MVFDILGLIDDLVSENDILVQSDIPFQQIIGGDPDIGIIVRTDQLLSGSGCAGKYFAGQLRRKTGNLLLPVIDQGGRCDDQGTEGISGFSVSFLREQESQGL